MPFVSDELATWLIDLLVDAGRKNLTRMVLGTDQERALRSAATAAVRETAQELSPDDDARAEDVAQVISQVFRKPIPMTLPGESTVTEALQAGIARQLAVLDDASVTATGRSSANLLGTPSEVVAETLTSLGLSPVVG